ncbi:MAG: FKBP-type peptidyl-prolyl cis-trans isomerase [Muribaculaceae bacterium]|nr:FKBP-type peptidyl-prolyl cis-trans isomerase [Muribaculaceae bacterium]
MKKFLFLAMVALLVGTTVTGCKGKSQSNKINDSIAELTGNFWGTQLKATFQFMPERFQDTDKDQLVKGILDMVNMDTTQRDMSYLQGMQMGMQIYQQLAQLEAQGVHVDRKLFINEFKKALDSKDTLDMQKLEKDMQEMNGKMMGMIERAQKIKGAENAEAGKNYIAEQMKKDKDFKQTKSGIAYKVVQEGKGENFTDDDIVNVAYVGKHIDGRVFDTSNGKEVPFTMQGVVPGFSEVLKLMKPGSKVIAIIPGNMAYQDRGDGRKIGPNETLVFEMTAGTAKKAPAQDANAAPMPGRPAPGQAAPGRPAPGRPAPAPKPAPAQGGQAPVQAK